MISEHDCLWCRGLEFHDLKNARHELFGFIEPLAFCDAHNIHKPLLKLMHRIPEFHVATQGKQCDCLFCILGIDRVCAGLKNCIDVDRLVAFFWETRDGAIDIEPLAMPSESKVRFKFVPMFLDQRPVKFHFEFVSHEGHGRIG